MVNFKRFLCVFTALCTVFLCSCSLNKTEIETTSAPVTETRLPDETVEAGAEYPDPVDFGEYRSVNREVYAYIKIPGTDIKYPVLQSGKSDDYYLRRDWKGASSYRGCIYTQSANAKEFTDPITVVYGHNTDKGDMFSQLLRFQDKEFFDSHDVFYIFIPGHILVYKIFSAHSFDDRHILNSYDFSSPEVLASFQQMLLNPSALEKNTREGVSLNEYSEIVILSTCAEPRSTSNFRYLVNGVLVNDVVTA